MEESSLEEELQPKEDTLKVQTNLVANSVNISSMAMKEIPGSNFGEKGNFVPLKSCFPVPTTTEDSIIMLQNSHHR